MASTKLRKGKQVVTVGPKRAARLMAEGWTAVQDKPKAKPRKKA
jgi:hypothetical protein